RRSPLIRQRSRLGFASRNSRRSSSRPADFPALPDQVVALGSLRATTRAGTRTTSRWLRSPHLRFLTSRRHATQTHRSCALRRTICCGGFVLRKSRRHSPPPFLSITPRPRLLRSPPVGFASQKSRRVDPPWLVTRVPGVAP